MIPVLYKFEFTTPLAFGVLYVLALALVAYAVFSGWRGAHGPIDPKSGEHRAATQSQRIQRAAIFGAIGAALARLGLYFALPASAFLGARGEGVPIHAYGILLATGFISAVMVGSVLAQREWRGEEGHRKREQLMDLAFWVLAAGIVGSRVLFILVNWKQYAANPSEIFSLAGGLVFYGGLVGAMIAAFVFARAHRIDFLRLGDLAIPTVSLGQAFGRLGCFSAGCCWGDVAHQGFLFGVHFPGAGLVRNLFGQLSHTASLAAQSQAVDSRWVVPATGEIFHHKVEGAVRISEWVAQHGHTLPVHPTQLYESIGQLAIFFGLLAMRRYRRFHGQILGMWLMAYAVLRTSVELFRGDLERGTLHGLLEALGLTGLAERVPLEAWYNVSTSQFISLCMFALGAAIVYRKGREVLARSGGLGAAPAAG
jgi:phosphatidylglycerol---prolipoprotein diacylglyceryl transferase